MARVKKFNPKHTRPDKKRDFYGPLPAVPMPPQAKGKKKTTNINIWDKAT